MLSQAEPAQAGPEAMKRRDLPLRGQPHPHDRLHPALYAAELSGTALLVSIGLPVVIALWGRGSPLAALLPDLGPRRAVNGFLFGSVAALVALSPLGRISGAHINPAVTLAFWLEGKIAWRDAGCYVVAQFLGAALGALPLLAWGAMGRSVDFGATLPAAGVPIWWPLLGEAGCAFLLVTVTFVMAAHPRCTRVRGARHRAAVLPSCVAGGATLWRQRQPRAQLRAGSAGRALAGAVDLRGTTSGSTARLQVDGQGGVGAEQAVPSSAPRARPELPPRQPGAPC
jgi:glycerol uptake facilitator-like aquaporin